MRDSRRDSASNKPAGRKPGAKRPEKGAFREKPHGKSRPERESRTGKDEPGRGYSSQRKFRSSDDSSSGYRRTDKKEGFQKRKEYGTPAREKSFNRGGKPSKFPGEEQIRLNKYIAHAGICSRREADLLIRNGAISVNGKIITDLGTKVKPDDVVKYGDQRLRNEKKVYLLLNKPKDFITTTDDPQGRKTVNDLIANACRERVYPVGRLDRNTTGLLMFTNDGEMARRLTHPRHSVSKIYHVFLDKPLTKADMAEIASGVDLEDTRIVPDSIAYVEGIENKKEVGIEIHSGQNRVVRRIFEKFGYDVVKLDRVSFAGLTKKDLPRGKWRFLTEKEVNFLRMR